MKRDWTTLAIMGLMGLSVVFPLWSMRVERHHELQQLAERWTQEGYWVCLRLRKKRIVGVTAHPYQHSMPVRVAGRVEEDR